MSELLPIQTQVPRCFGCGQENPSGIRLRFTKESDVCVSTRITPPPDWTGWGKLMHGGFHGLLIDETVGWAAWVLLKVMAFVTKEMAIRYRRPIQVGTPLVISGFIIEDKGRVILARGEIADEDGNVYTDADVVLARVDPSKVPLLTDDGQR